MNSSLRIINVGKNIMKIFPDETPLIGRFLNEIFALIQPNIYFEWDKVECHYFTIKHSLLYLRFFTVVAIFCFWWKVEFHYVLNQMVKFD